MSRTKTLELLFDHKREADRELCEFAATVAGRLSPASWRPILEQLAHVAAVDHIFRSHVSGSTHGLASTWPASTPDRIELAERIADGDAWFGRYLAGVTEHELEQVIRFVFTDGAKGTMTRAEMLLHVATHAAYHRGIAWTLLRQSVPGPNTLTLAGWLHQAEPARRDHGV